MYGGRRRCEWHEALRRSRILWISQALAVSRRQSASAFELRAALDLAQLLGDQGRRSEATAALAPAVAIFAATGNPPRLAEASALLTQLG